jgi:hypothetical protein
MADSNQELFQAMQMFHQGTQQMGLITALRNANQQVQDIKASAVKDEDKRAGLQQLSNSLVMQMAQYGTPASTMEQVSQAVTGPTPGNANQMNAMGLLYGNKGLQDTAQQQQSFEQNPEYKKQLISARYGNPLASQAAEEKKNEFNIKQFKDFSKDLDVTAASSRSAFGVAGITDQRAGRLKALIGSPENIKSATDADMTLLAEGLANMVKNGVAHKEEMDALLPKTSGSVAARTKQFFTNTPEPAQREAFIQRYQSLIGREKDQADSSITKTVLRRATGSMKLHDRDPEQFKLTVADSLKQALGKDVSPNEIVVQKGKPVRYQPAPATDGSDIQTRMYKGQQVRVRMLPDGKAEILE